MPPVSSGAAVAGDRVLVVDFGAQYAQLIARRVRDANVYSEIVPHDLTAAEFGERGRLWVVEMTGYMPDVDGTDEDAPWA